MFLAGGCCVAAAADDGRFERMQLITSAFASAGFELALVWSAAAAAVSIISAATEVGRGEEGAGDAVDEEKRLAMLLVLLKLDSAATAEDGDVTTCRSACDVDEGRLRLSRRTMASRSSNCICRDLTLNNSNIIQ